MKLSQLRKIVREELEKYDGGFTDEWNDQRKKNAEVLGYKLSGKSDIKEAVKDPKLKVGQKIRYKNDSRRLYTLKKITHGNRGIPEDPAGTSYMFVASGNRKEYHTKKTWAQAIKKGWIIKESINESGMGILDKDQTDVLHAIVMRNKNKNSNSILKIALKDRMFKGIDKRELLGYIEGAKQFVRYMGRTGNESVNEAIKPQGYSQLNTMVKHATIYLRDLSKALRKQDDDAVLREVHFLAAQFTTMEKMLKDKKWNAKYNESITINGKKYKPLNENDQSWAKYYSWRNDKSMTPKQKIGMSMREVRDSLQELEKIVFRSIKLKKELKVGSDNYWKSTHSALRRIHERLVKLTGKIANLY